MAVKPQIQIQLLLVIASVIERGWRNEGTKTEMFTWTPLSPILPGFTLLSLARVR